MLPKLMLTKFDAFKSYCFHKLTLSKLNTFLSLLSKVNAVRELGFQKLKFSKINAFRLNTKRIAFMS
jgi:hypothetical protein